MTEVTELRSYPKNAITGVVLSGGPCIRMNGKDKGLLNYEDNHLAYGVLSKLKKMVWEIVVSANQNISNYEDFGVPVIQDTRRDFGPLAGIEAVLERCPTEYIAIAPCDMPNIPENYVAELYFGIEETGSDISYLIWRDSEGNYTREPLLALIKTKLLPELQSYIGQGGKDVLDWYHQHSYVEVSFGTKLNFLDINHPEDLLG